LLPPAWSPALLTAPEFRLQSVVMAICLGLAAISPILGLLPPRPVILCALGLGIAALLVPVAAFLRILPAISAIYNQSLTPGWGVWVMEVGLVGMMAAALGELRYNERTKSLEPFSRQSLQRPSTGDLAAKPGRHRRADHGK
jgi:hypothetical protein